MALKRSYNLVNESHFGRPITIREKISFTTRHNLIPDVGTNVLVSAERIDLAETDPAETVAIDALCTVSRNTVIVEGLWLLDESEEQPVAGVYAVRVVLRAAASDPAYKAEEKNVVFEVLS